MITTTRRWRKTITLKDLLSDDTSDGAVRVAAAEVFSRLKRLPEYEQDFELEQLATEFDDISQQGSTGDDVYGGRFSLCDWFNAALSSLYDWADDERVWIA